VDERTSDLDNLKPITEVASRGMADLPVLGSGISIKHSREFDKLKQLSGPATSS
jgi:hypothetical protein